MAHQFVFSSSCLVAIAMAIAFEVADGCDSGFIQLDALRTVATKISGGGASNDRLNNELRLVPDQNFTCNGTITSFLLGMDIRTGKTLYPQVQIWRRTSSTSIREYMEVDFEEIRLDPGAFSPSGVFEYPLSTPINFQSGDILGVWQPRQQDSVVRIFYSDNDNSAPITYRRSSATNNVYNIDSNGFSSTQDDFILISPVTDPPCANGFLSSEELRNKTYKVNIYEAKLRSKQQRVFPDINFTCSGNLTKWIVGGEVGNSAGAELQIWRKNDGSVSDYTRVGYSVLQASDPENDDVYEYTPNPPLEFQEGDILGVYQRGGSGGGGGRMRVYYQETTGPPNYRRVGDLNTNPPVSSTLIGAILVTDEYDYPLVTVEISVNSASPTTTVQNQLTPSTMITSESQSTLITSELPSINSMITSTKITSIVMLTTSESQTMPYPTTIISDSSSITSVLPMLTSTTVTSVLLSQSTVGSSVLSLKATPAPPKDDITFYASDVYTGNSALQTNRMPIATISVHPQPSQVFAVGISSAVIGGAIAAVAAISLAIAGVVILVLLLIRRRHLYKSKVLSNQPHLMNPLYQEAKRVEDTCVVVDNHDLYDEVKESEEAFNIYDECRGENQSSSHAYQYVEQQSNTLKNILYEEFTYSTAAVEAEEDEASEEPIYWVPADDCSGIYEQFSSKRFREISTENIQATEHIGSGQFGLVQKGVWHSPHGSVMVAIKTLNEHTSEEEKVKFLQEAAIMGQFHHPNIVKLHGVVTVGEPVMLILELMSQDLRNYLFTLRPIPGEMAPPSLPRQLLCYCHQISSGMEYLSKKSFVHRDLAARNILVDDERTCKIADFGMSRDLDDENYYTSRGGMIPMKWTAIEAIHYKKYSTASDVWSFGVLMYEIWSLGHKPFEGCTNHQAVEMIRKGNRLSPPPGCTRALYEIMINCWHPETSGRPSFTTLVAKLSQPENQLLKWTGRDKSVTNSQSTMLGAPLETASYLHFDLQQSYLQ